MLGDRQAQKAVKHEKLYYDLGAFDDIGREKTYLADIIRSYSTDELGDAFLNSLLSILSNFTVGRESLLHDPTDIRDGEKPVLLPNIRPRALLPALVTAATGTVRMLRRCLTVRHSSSSSKTLTTPQKHQANSSF
nr:hypothetical protein PanWU01x14_356960 [Ipomoea batatas]